MIKRIAAWVLMSVLLLAAIAGGAVACELWLGWTPEHTRQVAANVVGPAWAVASFLMKPPVRDKQ